MSDHHATSLPDLAPVPTGGTVALDDAAARVPGDVPPKQALKGELEALRDRIEKLQRALYAEGRHALLVVLQGRDASGKDSTTRKVFQGVNPQGVEVANFKAPTPLELSHDFLWRVHLAVPPKGKIGVFNRSHYEDVLVVRVHRLVPESVWQERYEAINAFERMLVDEGVRILKFCLHISGEEQRQRLLERLDDPSKNWKFQAGDLAERKLWPEYRAAYEEALARCSTAWAPWYVVPADDKHVARVLIARKIVEALEAIDPQYPEIDAAAMALRSELERR